MPSLKFQLANCESQARPADDDDVGSAEPVCSVAVLASDRVARFVAALSCAIGGRSSPGLDGNSVTTLASLDSSPLISVPATLSLVFICAAI